MKTLSKILGVLVLCVIVALVVLRITGLNPSERRPGLWLTGNLVTAPVTDWSFTDKIQEINVQTGTWYGLPHSVTTWCVDYDNQLYLTSVYPPGVTTPNLAAGIRMWRAIPHVRLKIAGNLYDRTLQQVTDPAEKAAILAVKSKKYPQQKIRPDQLVNVFHVVPNQG